MPMLNVSKVSSLPATLVPSTMYLVSGANPADLEIHVTDMAGLVSRAAMTRAEVSALITAGVGTDNVVAAITVYKANEIVVPGNHIAFFHCHKALVFDKIVAATTMSSGHDTALQFELRTNMDNVIVTDSIQVANKTVTNTTFGTYTTASDETLSVTVTAATTNTTGKGLIVLLIKS